MKVSKAKEKLCPFMSIYFAADTPDLRTGGLVEVTCKCGDCMAWVYTKTHSDMNDEQYVETHPRNAKGHTHTIKWRASELKDNDKEGYCKRLFNE